MFFGGKCGIFYKEIFFVKINKFGLNFVFGGKCEIFYEGMLFQINFLCRKCFNRYKHQTAFELSNSKCIPAILGKLPHSQCISSS